jgi:hypothetical protein
MYRLTLRYSLRKEFCARRRGDFLLRGSKRDIYLFLLSHINSLNLLLRLGHIDSRRGWDI